MDMISLMKHDFRIVRLGADDARDKTDHLRSLSDLVATNEPMYPGIQTWFKEKVLPGITSLERVAFIGYLNDKPAISAVVKRGKRAKFCHLKINGPLQDLHFGELFFTLMALEVREFAQEIHFTLPEGLWEEERGFFQSFCFQEAKKSRVQYRQGEEELRCSAAFWEVWRAALDKLPKMQEWFSIDGFSLGNGLLMSIHPEYANKILKGEKTVEIRKKVGKGWVGKKVKIYSTSPERSIVGEARIGQVLAGHPSEIWDRFGAQMGCTKSEFDDYTTHTHEVSAVVFDDVRPYPASIPISQLSYFVESDLKPPQSYFELDRNKSWAQAVSVAALLQGSFKHIRPASLAL